MGGYAVRHYQCPPALKNKKVLDKLNKKSYNKLIKEKGDKKMEIITVRVLPECATFIRFDGDFEIWRGISGKIYRII